MAKRYLIINADDFGLCSASNRAVMELFESGYLKSSTIMMPCKGAEEAARFAAEHPEYAIGVHLTTTSEWDNYKWKPLTDGKTLVDENGWMWRSTEAFSKHADLKETRAELQAQLDKALSYGMKPSHLDNHMGSLYGNRDGRFTMLATALKFCGDHGYAFRLYKKAQKCVCPSDTPYFLLKASTLITKTLTAKNKVIVPDYLLFPDWLQPGLRESYEHYRNVILNLWTNIPEGITETFVHPCVEDEDFKTFVRDWQDRVWEYRLMKDPVMHQALKDSNIELISYRDLVRMKSK